MVRVQGLEFLGLAAGGVIEGVGDVVGNVFAGWGVDVDGGDGLGLGGGEIGGNGGFSFLW